MDHVIRTIDGLLDALGGTKAVAHWCCVSMGAVSQWRAANAVPKHWHFDLFREAERRGLNVDFDAVFPPSRVHIGEDPLPDPPLEAQGVMA